jgi:hypothetical protein
MTDENINDRLQKIESILAGILERNRKVELEKGWETSRTRVVSILALTYVLMCLIFYVLGVQNYIWNAIIPTVGYFLSTQSLPVIKKRWLDRNTKGSTDSN